jgi:hypothetical protein
VVSYVGWSRRILASSVVLFMSVCMLGRALVSRIRELNGKFSRQNRLQLNSVIPLFCASTCIGTSFLVAPHAPGKEGRGSIGSDKLLPEF